MLKIYHRKILREALQKQVSAQALRVIEDANVGQDALRGQIGHDEYHFDNNAFEESYAYIEKNRALIQPALQRGDADSAWQAFGRLSHTAQDFYAHSNYIKLWLAQFDEGNVPPVPEVAHADPAFLRHPKLASGKLYYPLEALSFIPALQKYVLPRLPKDSHAWMNLDSPEKGTLFDYAYQAAIKRTKDEWQKITEELSEEESLLFHGE